MNYKRDNFRTLFCDMRKSDIDCFYVEKYSELFQYSTLFKEGKIPNMVVIGPVGIGKTEAFKIQGREDSEYIMNGVSSAAYAYQWFYKQRAQAFWILDDVDNAFKLKEFSTILRAITSKRPSLVQWNKLSAKLEAEGIEKSFKCESNICMTMNHAGRHTSQEIKALFDRSKVLIFDPSKVEIMEFIKTWWESVNGAENMDIQHFAQENLNKIGKLKIRTLNKALDDKRNGLNWRQNLLNLWCEPEDPESVRMELIERLQDANHFPTYRAKVNEWIRVTGNTTDQSFDKAVKKWREARAVEVKEDVDRMDVL